MKPFDKTQGRGFTLIEVLVSVMIFSVVMTVALGALLAMSQSDKQAEELKTVVNNLDFALDSMTRTIRTGTG
jgi:prepilin-type N-terminal cleavage/methylation domain-containing protein